MPKRKKKQNRNFELFDILTLFYFGARRQDGEHYKLLSFEDMTHALNRYLHSLLFIRAIDIIKGDDVGDANVSFRAYLAELKRTGKRLCGIPFRYKRKRSTEAVQFKTYESCYTFWIPEQSAV